MPAPCSSWAVSVQHGPCTKAVVIRPSSQALLVLAVVAASSVRGAESEARPIAWSVGSPHATGDVPPVRVLREPHDRLMDELEWVDVPAAALRSRLRMAIAEGELPEVV